MKIATSTGDFARYCNNDLERIEELQRAGFRHIDLSQYSLTRNRDLLFDDDWKETVKKLQARADELGMEFVQSHAPGGELLDPNPEKRELLIQATIRSIHVAGELGVKLLVIHAGCEPYLTQEELYEKNLQVFKRFFPAMEETGVNLLIENSTHRNMKNASYFYTAKEMIDFIEYAGHSLLHACWDTGHANVEGDQSEQLAALGAHLYAVHINDNRGVLDEHILPFMGTINMDDVMYGLQKAGFSGPFTLESDSVLHPSDYWNGKRRVFLKDSRLAEPTLEMQRDVEKLAYDIAKHILKQYGLYES